MKMEKTFKPAWTPGPWRAYHQWHTGPWEVRDSGGNVIVRGLTEPMARLIAQAPAMYKALEAWCEAWEKSHQLEKTYTAMQMGERVLAAAGGRKDQGSNEV